MMRKTYNDIVNRGQRAAAKSDAYIEPIDVLVPVLPGDGRVGDVRLLRVILRVPVWLRSAGLSRRLRDVLGVNGKHAGSRLVRRHVGSRSRVEE